MKKLKLMSALALCGTLLFNVANASTVVTRNTSYGGATGTYIVGLGNSIQTPPTQSFSSDLDAQSYVITVAAPTGAGLNSFSISFTLDGVYKKKTFSVPTGATPGTVLTTFSAITDFAFSTYGYGVTVFYEGPGLVSYSVTKYSTP